MTIAELEFEASRRSVRARARVSEWFEEFLNDQWA